MAPTAGTPTTTSQAPLNKSLLLDRLRKRKAARTDTDSRQPLVAGGFHRSLDEADRLPRKLRVHFYSVIFAVLSAVAYVFDFGTDIFVVASQFIHCQYLEGALILIFAYVPSIFVNTLGYLWVVEDMKSRPPHRVTNRLKKPIWIVGLLTQTVPALYSLESAYYCYTFRKLLSASNGVVDARILELYYWILESDRDSTLLRVFIAFMESAPQLMIQAYVLYKHVLVAQHDPTTSLYAWAHYVSMAFSLFGLSWSIMSQHRCIRYVRQDKENLGILQCFMVFVWRTLTLIGRFVALLLFALVYEYWLALLLASHFVVVLFVVDCIERPRLSESSFQQNLLMLGIGWVHLFCPWNVEEGRTRYRYVWRYGLEWLELAIIITLLFHGPRNGNIRGRLVFIIIACSCYVVGLLVMCVYYAFCHPNRTLGRRRYPPLVVVYTPPEKSAPSSPAKSSIPRNVASDTEEATDIAVGKPETAVIRRENDRLGDENDTDCCGLVSGRQRNQAAAAATA